MELEKIFKIILFQQPAFKYEQYTTYTTFYLSIHLMMDILVDSIFWLL